MNIIYLFVIVIITIFIVESEQNISTNSTAVIDLQAITDSSLFDLTTQIIKKLTNAKSIMSAQIYSSQLSEDTISRYFTLVNKTHLIKSEQFTRHDLCSSMKYCENLLCGRRAKKFSKIFIRI